MRFEVPRSNLLGPFFTSLDEMDSVSQRISTAHGRVNGGSTVDYSITNSAACNLCGVIIAPDNEATGDLETISLCGDCKFLLLEDVDTPVRISRRRQSSRRRNRYSSSESIENFFSQQFSHMVNMARQNLSTGHWHEHRIADDDATGRLLRTSSRTTPSGSRRWRRVLSDTESEGFDYNDYTYGESESNASLSRYRCLHGETDAISFSAYGGDSDASMDGNSLLDTELFVQPDDGNNLNGDSDIDPMHAGLNQWNSDDQEEEEEEENEEWEDIDTELDTVDTAATRTQIQNFLTRPSESNSSINWNSRFDSPDLEGMIRRIRGGRHTVARNIFASLDEPDLTPYTENSGDYLGARGFEELLERLAETGSSRRGAPPAAISFVNNLPRVIVNDEHEKNGGLACAICKDVLASGTEVNQLPCLHLYHPSCILPWLTARNSCPICRYELPTDDKDYEEQKQNINVEVRINEIQELQVSEDSSSDVSDEAEAHEFCGFETVRTEEREQLDVHPTVNTSSGEQDRRRWFFLTAAPVVSLASIVLVLWLGTPGRNGLASPYNPHPIHYQRGNRRRRWWPFF